MNRLTISVPMLVAALNVPDLSPRACAQENSHEPSASEESSDYSASVAPFLRYTFPAALDGGNGDFSVWRAGLDYTLTGPFGDAADFAFTTDYEFNNYDFNRPNNFLTGVSDDPFSEIHILDVGLTLFGRADEKGWSWFGGVMGRVAGEGGAEFDDSATFGGMVGASCKVSDDFSYSIGIRATSQIEDDALILPAITLDWRLDENWRFIFAGSRAELACSLAEDLSLGIGAGWENRRFRLDDDAPTSGAIIEDTSIPVFLRLSRSVDDSLNIDVTAGVTLYSEFEIQDRNGNASRTVESDPAPFMGLSIRWSF